MEIGGNWSAGKPAIWKTELPEVILTRSLPVSSTMVSALDSARMIGTSFLTGKVMRPGEETAALMRQQMPRSRFVVVSVMVSPSASISTFCRIGIVARFPTTLVTLESPLKKWFRLTLNFMMGSELSIEGASGNPAMPTPGGPSI